MKGYQILILEDDVVTSVALARALQNEIPDAHILRAASLFEARLLFSSFDIQFFVIDIVLPDGNGIDFVLDVSTRTPQAGVAIMTAEPLPKHRDRASSYGALYFFEKPLPPRTLGQIIRTHQANSGPSGGADTSFTASITRLNALDAIQLKCLGRCTLRLDFRIHDGRFGSVYFAEGKLVHAEANSSPSAPPTTGLTALSEILSWRGGRIEEVKNIDTPEPTLHGSWQAILLEAAQMRDESASP